MKIILLAFLLSTNLVQARRAKLRPIRNPIQKFMAFKSDGCSAYPNKNHFYGENDWNYCCVAHDIAYYLGGTEEEKTEADEALEMCVADETFSFHGFIMKAGVSIGGTPLLETPWRWGYGWQFSKGYKEYNFLELDEMSEHLYSIEAYIAENEQGLSQEEQEYLFETVDYYRQKFQQKVLRDEINGRATP